MKCFLLVSAILLATLVASSEGQDQAYKIIPSYHKLHKYRERLVDLDIDLKKDSIVHIIGRVPLTKKKGGKTVVWSGIDIDQPDKNAYWYRFPSMELPVFDSDKPITLTTSYAVKLKAGRHKIYWNYSVMPPSPMDHEIETFAGGSLMVHVFDGTIGGEVPEFLMDDKSETIRAEIEIKE